MQTKPTPVKAIRAKCLDCSNNQTKEIRLCPVTDCPLFYFRMGKNPNRAGIKSNNAINSIFRSKSANNDENIELSTENVQEEKNEYGNR